MTLGVKFSEGIQSFAPQFGEVNNVSDGGFEHGYDAGYDKGSADGYGAGYSEGHGVGYSEGHGAGKAEGYHSGYEVGKVDGAAECKNEMQTTIDGLIDKSVTYIESNATTLPQMGLYNCGQLQTAILPELESIGSMAMYGCRVLTKAVMPNLRVIEASGMHDCNMLPELDCRLERAAANAFCGCQQLRRLIIRSEEVCVLEGDPFMATPIQNGDGFVYVLDKLVDSCKIANIWSTYATQVKPISELKEEAHGATD